jgi:outer membrane protein OmpA-like peptidoglycan-associated protein
MEALRAQHARTQSERDDLSAAVEDADARAERATAADAEVQRLQEALDEAGTETQRLQQQLEESQQAQQALTRERDELREEMLEIRGALDTSREERGAALALAGDAEERQQALESAVQGEDLLRRQLSDMQRAQSQLKDELQAAEKALEKAQLQASQGQTRVGELDAELASARQSQQQLDELRQEADELRGERELLRDKLAKVGAALAETRNQLEVVRAHQGTLAEETNRLRSQLAQRDRDTAELMNEVQRLSRQLEKKQSAAADASAASEGAQPSDTQPEVGEVATLEGSQRAPAGEQDSDSDGIADSGDLCLDTPADTEVDEIGCAMDASIRLEGVNFRYDSAELTSAARAVLDRVATTLSRYPDFRLEVAGHTDAQGDRDYNQHLSQQRAEAVRDYLVAHGVNADNITARGFGSRQPLADNSTREGLLKNRRVELRRLR